MKIPRKTNKKCVFAAGFASNSMRAGKQPTMSMFICAPSERESWELQVISALLIVLLTIVLWQCRRNSRMRPVPTETFTEEVEVRTVATQSMVTYRRTLNTPRFEWIEGRDADGAWVIS